MSKITSIIFDLGGVILHQPKELMHTVLKEVFPDKINNAYKLWEKEKDKTILGKITTKELIESFKKKLREKSSYSIEEKLKNAYKKHSADVNEKLLLYIEKLKRRYKVYLLTDTIDLHDSYNKTRDIYSRFEEVFKSFEEHLKKSDKKAFINILNKIEAEPKDVLLVDDLKENILTAKELGINSVQYENFDQLIEELKKYEIRI